MLELISYPASAGHETPSAREVERLYLQVVETADEAMKTGDVVRVDLANPRGPPPSIALLCDRTRPSSAENTPFDAIGFRVREAFLQHTELTVGVQSDWSVQAAESQNVRRVGALRRKTALGMLHSNLSTIKAKPCRFRCN